MTNGRPWTEAEDALLREHYPEHGADWDRWAELLPGRSRFAIRTHASQAGIAALRHGKGALWKDREDEVVREHYPVHGPLWFGWAVLLPGRFARAIIARADRLGLMAPVPILQRASEGSGWTSSEREALLRAVETVATVLGRDAGECVEEAHRLHEAWLRSAKAVGVS